MCHIRVLLKPLWGATPGRRVTADMPSEVSREALRLPLWFPPTMARRWRLSEANGETWWRRSEEAHTTGGSRLYCRTFGRKRQHKVFVITFNMGPWLFSWWSSHPLMWSQHFRIKLKIKCLTFHSWSAAVPAAGKCSENWRTSSNRRDVTFLFIRLSLGCLRKMLGGAIKHTGFRRTPTEQDVFYFVDFYSLFLFFPDLCVSVYLCVYVFFLWNQRETKRQKQMVKQCRSVPDT